MTLKEKIKQSIINFLGINKLVDNPNGDRYTYLQDKDDISKRRLQEYRVWYYGDSDELLNFYTAMGSYGNAENPIYNRNKTQYFWGLSERECEVKRVHSGIPNAIVTTLVNAVGTPMVDCKGKEAEVKKILDNINFKRLLNQKQLPMTMALGWGAFKVIIDRNLCADSPLVEWYNAEDVDFVIKHDKVIGFIFKDYFNYKDKDYVLYETRSIKRNEQNIKSCIEYKLCRLEKNNEITEVPLSTIPELANYTDLEIEGIDMPLAVECSFFYDNMGYGYGKSIFAGKIDMFDELDQDLSQASQTCRVSTPVEYYPVDVLERRADGSPKMPSTYNRQYVQSVAYPNGDGEVQGEIKTTQPQLNFQQYSQKCMDDLSMILTGILSPATMGIDVAKKDNADAQREKEKITLMTRNNIIDEEEKIIKKLLKLCLMLQDYMTNGKISLVDYDVSVKFEEFASPSFDSKVKTLLPLYQAQAISTEMFVDKLYEDSLSDEERQKEVEAIKEMANTDMLGLGDIDNESDESAVGGDLPTEEEESARAITGTEQLRSNNL